MEEREAEQNHERDFEVVSYVDCARFLWEFWLRDERNKDFLQLYMSKPVQVRVKLDTFFMQPFRLMDEILSDWDFHTASVSVYQYTSFLVSVQVGVYFLN